MIQFSIVANPTDKNYFKDQNYHRKLWKNGSVIKYFYVTYRENSDQILLDNIPSLIQVVEEGFKTWAKTGKKFVM